MNLHTTYTMHDQASENGEQAKMNANARTRSADLQSAVSQICNLRSVGRFGALRSLPRPAECNSAIQQIENLRYDPADAQPFHALLHGQSSGVAHNPAVTGLFLT